MEYKNELTHWGIKGMKWGVRRYQNKDGTLTNAGKKRKAKLEAKLKQLGGKKKSANRTEARNKPVSEMTDKELQKYTARMQLEKNFYDAKRNLEAANPKQVSNGQKFVNKFINDAVLPSVTSAGKSYLESYMKKTLGLSTEDTLSALKKTYEKLDYEQKIDKINNPDKYLSWEDRKKKREYDDETERRANAKKTEAAGSKTNTESSNSNKENTNQSENTGGNSKSNKKAKKAKSKSESKVYEGTVEGVGNSSKQKTTSNTNTRNSTVIDAEWSEVNVSNVPATVTNQGRSYISGLLEEPKRRGD